MNKGNNKFAVKRTRTGLGLFTLEPIKADRRIIEYVGPVISAEEADRRGGRYLFELDEKRAIDGRARSNTARYINHSCSPNAKGYTTGRRIWIWSLKAIKAGEEITIDYGKEYLDAHIEQCKCPNCETRTGKKAKKLNGRNLP
ncbi:MAG TPA: SET domain-containing protein [Pyrinomonadaceae bacterium]|nr:SET domain-containing protein [Pyrinomonadaceae bacterium]